VNTSSTNVALIAALVAAPFWIGACKSPPPADDRSNLTQGMAKKNIIKGQTSQAEVLEIFGPPDLTTYKDGTEVWTYDKVSQEISSGGSYFTVLIAGARQSSSSSSSRSTMLILYFDRADIVQDYRMSVSRF